jgi:O-antigen/teichoic acid export membrane protein
MKTALKHTVAALKESAFFKNIIIVMSGTALAQIIGYAMSPIISRLFTPAEFGVFGSFSAIAGVISAGVTLEYTQAIMLPREKEDAINLFAVSILSTGVISFLALLFCVLTPGTANNLMKTQGVWALAMLVIATLTSGLNNAFQAWAVRVKAFKQTSASQVVRSVSSNGSRIIFGSLRMGAVGLVISNILANILASINVSRVFFSELPVLRSSINWLKIKRLAAEYRDFPMYSASQGVINALSSGLPVLLLTRFYNISVAGAYAFGVSILQVPMGFVLTALRQVLFQKASESQHQGKSLASLYIRTTAVLFFMALIPSIVLIIWAPQIFSVIFGARWHLAGELARSLIIWLAVVFCNLPAVLFARIIRVQRFVFFYDLALLAARTMTLVIGGSFLNVHQTVTLFAVVGAIMNAFLILRIGYLLMKKEGKADIMNIQDYILKN